MSETVVKPKVILSVKVDGKEVYLKEDDLLTKWFNRDVLFYITRLNLPLKTTTGSEYQHSTHSTTIRLTDVVGPTKIAIGTDATEPSPTDYELKSKYMENTTLDIKVYQETDNYVIADISASFSIPEDITIYEFGLYNKFMFPVTGIAEYLVARDVVPEGIPVTAGQVLTITYRFIIGTYP